MGVEIPTTVTAIGAWAFAGAEGMTDIEIPSSVSSIGSNAFFGCHMLSAVTMDGRTKAETKAIANYPWSLSNGSVIHCTDGDIAVGLTKVTYTDGRTVELDIQGELGEASIPDREYISELDIGSAVTSIGEHAFDRCAYLETVIIPESVETIGTMGFSRTVRLTSITIKGNGLKVIGLGAFAAETALSSISLPDSVVSIGRSAFEDCVSLTSIAIPASVQTMDKQVFFGCSGLTSVTIGDGVTSIGIEAFYGCSELTSVTFSGKTKSTVQGMDNYSWELPSGCVLHCTDGDIVVGSTSVVYQDGQQQEIPIFGELTRNSIPNISNVASVNIGEAVTSIGRKAFLECSGLTSVTIPNSVTSIGKWAFDGCSELTSVTFSGKDMATVQGMSDYRWGLSSDCVLHCTDGDITVGV